MCWVRGEGLSNMVVIGEKGGKEGLRGIKKYFWVGLERLGLFLKS